jgi:hypothetical protein
MEFQRMTLTKSFKEFSTGTNFKVVDVYEHYDDSETQWAVCEKWFPPHTQVEIPLSMLTPVRQRSSASTPKVNSRQRRRNRKNTLKNLINKS